MNAANKASNASDETVASIFNNKFCIPLDFEILESSLPLCQYGLGSHLTLSHQGHSVHCQPVNIDPRGKINIKNFH